MDAKEESARRYPVVLCTILENLGHLEDLVDVLGFVDSIVYGENTVELRSNRIDDKENAMGLPVYGSTRSEELQKLLESGSIRPPTEHTCHVDMVRRSPIRFHGIDVWLADLLILLSVGEPFRANTYLNIF